MASNNRAERLALLKGEAERSLHSALDRLELLRTGRPGHRGVTEPRSHAGENGMPRSTADLMGGTFFPDDERRLRALAKEIKRLITEDTRRGLAV